ncbi:MAG: SDR family oxidoreductase [Pseudomonadota bacterium]
MPNSNIRVLITGANRGIGLALTKQFADRGYKVIAVCRQSSAELKKLPVEVIDNIDVTQSDSIRLVLEILSGRSIEILINNAGILRADQLFTLDDEDITNQFLVNALAPLRVTQALVHLLSENSKVIMITSRMGSMADNTSGSYYGYRMSKAALNAVAVSLANDLKDKKVAVAAIHPGFVQTDMVDHAGDISADTAAERIVARIDALDLKNTGTFFHSNGEILPW